MPLVGLLGGQRQAMLNELRKEQKRVAELEGTVAPRGNGKGAGRANPKSERPIRGEQACGASRELRTIGARYRTPTRFSGERTRGACAHQTKSKDNFEELNAVPFSGVIRIERRAFHPSAVAGGRPRIEHLEGVTAGAKPSRNHPLHCRAF